MATKVYTVGWISNYIKNMFVSDYLLRNVTISGEISNLKYHSSGHIYFSLKDKTAVLDCIMFKSSAVSLKFRLTEGLKVNVTGRIENFEKTSKYQLYATNVEEEGTGELYKRFEQLKTELMERGMFDEMYKTPIGKYNQRVGIVTSPTGAAIEDIVNVSKRRNPYVNLFLYPALVQGEGACIDIAKGIKRLDEMGLDVIIVGRGGGSIEDLWAFNEEVVAEAIFNAKTPIISAVGHQTDYTIADFVSDLRAPTPSAAAELAVFEYSKFSDELNQYVYSLKNYLRNCINRDKFRISNYASKLKSKSPTYKLDTKKFRICEYERLLREKVDFKLSEAKDKTIDYNQKMSALIKEKLVNRKHRLSLFASKLSGKSPLEKIGRGYAFAEAGGKGVCSINDIKKGDRINLSLPDGKAVCTVDDITRRNHGREE